ncbi:type I restriction-modification system, M subunit [human gut metagenome]|uniref:Type I restriction-modification system, M subunit n=1 Tax=human gut metagenome TaxID=408170 RepID=K1UAA4_9ZZZZ
MRRTPLSQQTFFSSTGRIPRRRPGSIAGYAGGIQELLQNEAHEAGALCPAVEWWDNREEITIDGFDKAKKYTVEELKARSYNIDLCGYPHEEEEILPPKELIQQYQEKRASLNADIDRILAQITDILGIDITEEGDE